jgi:hypothetical protein
MTKTFIYKETALYYTVHISAGEIFLKFWFMYNTLKFCPIDLLRCTTGSTVLYCTKKVDPKPIFVNVPGAQEWIPPAYVAWRNRFLGL